MIIIADQNHFSNLDLLIRTAAFDFKKACVSFWGLVRAFSIIFHNNMNVIIGISTPPPSMHMPHTHIFRVFGSIGTPFFSLHICLPIMQV